MNNVILTGRLTKDPEVSYKPGTSTVMAIAHFFIAVPRMKKDDGADYPRITVFGKQAENCEKYLSKGSQIAVVGRLQTGSYKNSEGITIYTTDVIADRIEFLSTNKKSEASSEPEPEQQMFDDLPDTFQAAEDDLPF